MSSSITIMIGPSNGIVVLIGRYCLFLLLFSQLHFLDPLMIHSEIYAQLVGSPLLSAKYQQGLSFDFDF